MRIMWVASLALAIPLMAGCSGSAEAAGDLTLARQIVADYPSAVAGWSADRDKWAALLPRGEVLCPDGWVSQDLNQDRACMDNHGGAGMPIRHSMEWAEKSLREWDRAYAEARVVIASHGETE